MTNTKHTPGPWEAVHDGDGDYGIFGDNQGGPLATTYTDSPEDAANARLIAAAPAMLEALEFAYLNLSDLSSTKDDDTVDKKIRAAIRLAVGETDQEQVRK